MKSCYLSKYYYYDFHFVFIDLSDNKHHHLKEYVNTSNGNTMPLPNIFEINFTCSVNPNCNPGGVTCPLANSEEKPTYK